MPSSKISSQKRQRGVAVVTALLLTTLAITIVASLFWQQQVQVRSIENQRFQLQKKWVLLGAVDWARLILREDARNSNVDYIGEPWSVGLEDTKLSDYLENSEGTDGSDASLSGHIIDAQSLFNLNNLARNGAPVPDQVLAFARLLGALRFDTGLAEATAQSVALTQTKAPAVNGAGSTAASNTSATSASNASVSTPAPVDTTVQFLRFNQTDDLLSVSGFNPDMVAKLRDYVTVLPVATAINVNTAPPEVLMSLSSNISQADAAAIVTSRDRAYFRDASDFSSRFAANLTNVPATSWDVKTNYFIVYGVVKLNRSELETHALIQRSGTSTKIVWVREN